MSSNLDINFENRLRDKNSKMTQRKVGLGDKIRIKLHENIDLNCK